MVLQISVKGKQTNIRKVGTASDDDDMKKFMKMMRTLMMMMKKVMITMMMVRVMMLMMLTLDGNDDVGWLIFDVNSFLRHHF